MFWDKLSKKERIGLSFAFLFIATASLDRIIISPIREHIARIDRAIKIGEKQLAHDLRNVHQKDQITEKFEKYVEYVQRSGSDEEEVARILEDALYHSGYLCQRT